MTYLAMLMGAIGIQYFVRRCVCVCVCVRERESEWVCVCVFVFSKVVYFQFSPGQFPYAETSWSECRRLSLEFRELSSAILSEGPGLSVTPSVSSGIIATAWGERVNGTWVVAAVNVLNTPV